MMGEVVAFHGTNAEAAGKILVEGFKAGTYFAFRIEDAVAFGGPHLFVVRFDNDPQKWHGLLDWQFHLRDVLGPEAILASFDLTPLLERAEMGDWL